MEHNAKALGEAILALTLSTTIAKTKTFEVPLSEFPVEAIESFLRYGFQRKFNDAVGGATRDDKPYTAAEKVADAEAMIADYKLGKITKRREGTGATDEQIAARRVIRKIMKAQLPDKDWKAFVALEAVAQLADLDSRIAKNDGNEVFAELVATELAEMLAARERNAATAKATVNL